MDIIALVGEYGPWSWIVGGLVLLAVELIVPGGILVWLGVAAIAVGVVTLVQPLDWALQWGLYGVLAIVSILAWLNFARRHKDVESDRPFLNRRGDRIVGRETVLKEAIVDGFGRVQIGDSTWRVNGPDLPEGARVKVVGLDGTVLLVEPIQASDQETVRD